MTVFSSALTFQEVMANPSESMIYSIHQRRTRDGGIAIQSPESTPILATAYLQCSSQAEGKDDKSISLRLTDSVTSAAVN